GRLAAVWRPSGGRLTAAARPSPHHGMHPHHVHRGVSGYARGHGLAPGLRKRPPRPPGNRTWFRTWTWTWTWTCHRGLPPGLDHHAPSAPAATEGDAAR